MGGLFVGKFEMTEVFPAGLVCLLDFTCLLVPSCLSLWPNSSNSFAAVAFKISLDLLCSGTEAGVYKCLLIMKCDGGR